MKKLMMSIGLIVLCGVSAINAFDNTLYSIDRSTGSFKPRGTDTYLLPKANDIVDMIKTLPLQEQKELLMNPDMTINTAIVDRFIRPLIWILDDAKGSAFVLAEIANSLKQQIVKSVFRLLVGCGFVTDSTDEATKTAWRKQIDDYCENKMLEYIQQKYPQAHVVIGKKRSYMGLEVEND